MYISLVYILSFFIVCLFVVSSSSSSHYHFFLRYCLNLGHLLLFSFLRFSLVFIKFFLNIYIHSVIRITGALNNIFSIFLLKVRCVRCKWSLKIPVHPSVSLNWFLNSKLPPKRIYLKITPYQFTTWKIDVYTGRYELPTKLYVEQLKQT